MRKQLLNFALCAATLLGCEKNEKATTTAPEIVRRECTSDELKQIENIANIVKTIGKMIINIEPDSQDVTPAILQPEKTNFACTNQGPTINCEPTQPRVCTVNPIQIKKNNIQTNVGNFAGAQIDNREGTTTGIRYKNLTEKAITTLEPN
jgi:hypothetical protein